MIERQNVDGSEHPNFISAWTMPDATVCDNLITFFEDNDGSQSPGIAGDGNVTDTIKKSMDMTIDPRDLEDERFAPVARYMEVLSACFKDYLMQWEFLKSILPNAHVGSFNIQRYDEGGHYQGVHSERVSLDSIHRMLVWMTYLNHVDEGGETEFPHYGLKVKPARGKTIIWPAEWTHAHAGGLVTKGRKYIITGWMHFPDGG